MVMTIVLQVCFIHQYNGKWHLKLIDVLPHSLTFDELEDTYSSLEEARAALTRYKPEARKLVEQRPAGEIWG
jgi:hypothetical protein